MRELSWEEIMASLEGKPGVQNRETCERYAGYRASRECLQETLLSVPATAEETEVAEFWARADL